MPSDMSTLSSKKNLENFNKRLETVSHLSADLSPSYLFSSLTPSVCLEPLTELNLCFCSGVSSLLHIPNSGFSFLLKLLLCHL